MVSSSERLLDTNLQKATYINAYLLEWNRSVKFSFVHNAMSLYYLFSFLFVYKYYGKFYCYKESNSLCY